MAPSLLRQSPHSLRIARLYGATLIHYLSITFILGSFISNCAGVDLHNEYVYKTNNNKAGGDYAAEKDNSRIEVYIKMH